MIMKICTRFMKFVVDLERYCNLYGVGFDYDYDGCSNEYIYILKETEPCFCNKVFENELVKTDRKEIKNYDLFR